MLPTQENISTNVAKTKVMTEPEIKQLAHLPMLIFLYLSIQKQLVATPVTALELAAYLGIDLGVSEDLLKYLEGKGIVRAFSDEMPAYSLAKELNQIHVGDLLEILAECHTLLKNEGSAMPKSQGVESEKYRKMYSDLASEILQLFGERAANELPV